MRQERITGADLAQRLHNARRIGPGRWTAACPTCQPEGRHDQSALSIRDDGGQMLLRCFKNDCTFRDVLTAAGVTRGGAAWTPPDPVERARREAEALAEAQRRSARAAAIWSEAAPITGTAAEGYLRVRCIDPAPLSGSLRYHPRCWHDWTRQALPALVCRLEGTTTGLPAIWRTWIRPDGAGKAEVAPPRAALGSARGGGARIIPGDPGGPVLIGEGLETTCSAHHLLGDPACSAWAGLTAGGMAGFSLPPGAGRRLIIALDPDDAGRRACRALGIRAAALGWRVEVLDPGRKGRDWNDIARGMI